MAERFGIQEWDMPRLTGRALDLIEAALAPEDDVDDVEIPEGAERMSEPPVPSALRGM